MINDKNKLVCIKKQISICTMLVTKKFLGDCFSVHIFNLGLCIYLCSEYILIRMMCFFSVGRGGRQWNRALWLCLFIWYFVSRKQSGYFEVAVVPNQFFWHGWIFYYWLFFWLWACFIFCFQINYWLSGSLAFKLYRRCDQLILLSESLLIWLYETIKINFKCPTGLQ